MSDCQPFVSRTETPSFWRLRSLSFKGNLERTQCSIFLVIFGSISTFCFSAGAGAQRCRGNWSKTARAVSCCHLQHIISKLNFAVARRKLLTCSAVPTQYYPRHTEGAMPLRCLYGINRSGTAMIVVVPQWFRH